MCDRTARLERWCQRHGEFRACVRELTLSARALSDFTIEVIRIAHPRYVVGGYFVVELIQAHL